jgi:hypothetical protein
LFSSTNNIPREKIFNFKKVKANRSRCAWWIERPIG